MDVDEPVKLDKVTVYSETESKRNYIPIKAGIVHL